MAKKRVLGKNPFAPAVAEPARATPASGKARPAPTARAAAKAKGAEKSKGKGKAQSRPRPAPKARPARAGAPAEPVVAAPVAAEPVEHDPIEREPIDQEPPREQERGGRTNGTHGPALPPVAVPIEATAAEHAPAEAESDAPGSDELEADEPAYGADAAVRPTDGPAEPDYGPSVDRRVRDEGSRRGLTDEFRQLERFIRERVLPTAPGGSERRRLPLEFLWRRWRDLAMIDRSDYVDEFGRDPMYTARVEPVLDFLYRRYFRVEVVGIDNVPAAGRGLIVANHSGTLPYDGAMVMHAVKREHPAHRDVRPLVEDFVFHFPYLGTFINRVGGVRACQENAERLLLQDQLAAVFPEGVKGIGKLYRDRYRLQRFGRGGFIKLALRTDSPILPCAILGAEEIHPMIGKVTWLAKTIGVPYIPITPTFPWLGPLGAIPLPTKWTIAFGAPLYFNDEYGREGADDRILVNRLSEHVRARIQEMLDGLQRQRKSVLLG